MNNDLRIALNDELSAVHPPRAEVAGIKHRGVRMRRRRHLIRGGGLVASAAVIAVVFTAVQVDDGDRTRGEAASDSSGVPDELVLTIPGSNPIELPDAVAGCLESETKPGTKVLWVIAGVPGNGTSSFYMMVPEAELDLPLTVTLPWVVRQSDGSESFDHTVFAGAAGNEASGDEEGATGAVEVLAGGCEVGSQVRVSVDAHLGSELEGGQDIDVIGGLSTTAIDLESYFNDLEDEASGNGAD